MRQKKKKNQKFKIKQMKHTFFLLAVTMVLVTSCRNGNTPDHTIYEVAGTCLI